MSDADNQTGGSGDRFSKEDQDKRQGTREPPKKEIGGADKPAREAGEGR